MAVAPMQICYKGSLKQPVTADIKFHLKFRIWSQHYKWRKISCIYTWKVNSCFNYCCELELQTCQYCDASEDKFHSIFPYDSEQDFSRVFVPEKGIPGKILVSGVFFRLNGYPTVVIRSGVQVRYKSAQIGIYQRFCPAMSVFTDHTAPTMSSRCVIYTWWRYHIETLSSLLTLCEGNPPVIGGSP